MINPEIIGIDTQNYNVVINAIAALRLGYRPQQAIGKTFRSGKHVLTIVGVFSNPRLDGPQVSISPVVFYNDPQSMERISVRLKSGQLSQGLSEIDRAWRQFAPNTAVERRFLSDSFARMFRADAQRGRIFTVFVALAISIACLGLYGLAAFTVRRRAREVSIRKVFGARTRDVVLLLLWQFSAPVLLANLIAWPITWYYLSDWLDSFAARIWLSPAYFAAAGLVALLIAWITVGAHALHAARAKPASALHYE